MEQGQNPDRNVDSHTGLTPAEWLARHRLRERKKLVGLLIVVLFILALAFLRFGKTIPWAAR